MASLEAAPPKVDLRIRSESGRYAAKAKAVVIRHVTNHRIVVMIEIVSPGNKSSQTALNAFVRKAREALSAGVHLSLVDLFPPEPRNPAGIYRAVSGEDGDDKYTLPRDKPLWRVLQQLGADPIDKTLWIVDEGGVRVREGT